MRAFDATKRRIWLPLAGAIMLATAIALPLGLHSCQVIRNADGTFTIEISADKAITATGLENALMLLVKMLAECTSGYLDCTQDELNAINEAIETVGNLKSGFAPRPLPPWVPPQLIPPSPPQPGG